MAAPDISRAAPSDLGGLRAVADGEGVSMAAPAFSWWFEGRCTW